jgi:hypothetical protein
MICEKEKECCIGKINRDVLKKKHCFEKKRSAGLKEKCAVSERKGVMFWKEQECYIAKRSVEKKISAVLER